MHLRTFSILVCGASLVAACSAKGSDPAQEAPPSPDAGGGQVDSDAGAPRQGPGHDAGPSADKEAATSEDAGSEAGQPAGDVFQAFPLVTPPVRAAAPAGFGGTGSPPSGFTTQSLRIGRTQSDEEFVFARADRPRFGEGPTAPSSVVAGGGFHLTSLASSDIRSRFFSAGPTNIYSLLGAIDDRITGINGRAQTTKSPCLAQAPVPYTITPFGQSLTFYVQCYEEIGSSAPGDPGFVQFGMKDGVTYYYSAIGAGWTAAILTPTGGASSLDGGVDAEGGGPQRGSDVGTDGSPSIGADGSVSVGSAGGAYVVKAWSGVGYLNAGGCGNKSGFDDCSYGVIEIQADSSQRTFEMAVAGIGFGYCGAQLKSDGTTVYGIGSPDMGTTCAAADTFCVAASDVTTAGVCDPSIMTFALPALGRMSSTGPNAGGPGPGPGPGVDAGSSAAWAASQYPGGPANRIVLDGTTSDSLYFGPTSPTPGAGAF
jgi:hypothetical protein